MESTTAVMTRISEPFQALQPQTSWPVVHFEVDETQRELRYLREHDFLQSLERDLETLGYVGDPLGKKVLYIAASSRRLDHPVSVMTVSRPGTGKSHSHQTIASLLPPEEILSLTRITEKAFSHFPQEGLRHRALFLDEFDGCESDASPLRSLLSRGYLTSAIPSANPESGLLETQTKVVSGPVALFSSTCDPSLVGDELASRLLFLGTPDGEESRQAILDEIARGATRQGLLLADERERIRTSHRLRQRLLRPIKVVLPEQFLEEGKRLGLNLSQNRRLQNFINFTKAITFLRQHQRRAEVVEEPGTSRRTEFLTAQPEDLALASELLGQVFGSFDEELTPLDRQLYSDCLAFCQAQAVQNGSTVGQVQFCQRDIRQQGGWGLEISKRAFRRLVEAERLLRVCGRERSRSWFRINTGELVEAPATPNPARTGSLRVRKSPNWVNWLLDMTRIGLFGTKTKT